MNTPLGDFDAIRDHAIKAGMPALVAATLRLHEEMGFTVAYRPGTSDEGVLEHSFARDIFLSGLPEYQPKKDHVVVEIGGHLGDFALLVSRLVGRVYTVEARQETFGLLSTNLRVNSADNVIADRLAISDTNNFVTLYHAPEGESWGDSTTLNFNGTSETVPARTLARYLFERNIAQIDLIKFNCEGAEFAILLSADHETLAKFNMMLVLFHGDLVEGMTGDMLAAHLQDAGFTTVIRQQHQQRGWIIASRTPQVI